jgi:anti-anti-sigma factor
MTLTTLDAARARAGDLPPFLVSIDVVGGRVSLHGELDHLHVDRVLESVDVLRFSEARSWTIDVDGVTFCDAAGLRGLLAAQQLAADAGRPLGLTRCGPWLRELVDAAGLECLLQPSRTPGAPQPRG